MPHLANFAFGIAMFAASAQRHGHKVKVMHSKNMCQEQEH